MAAALLPLQPPFLCFEILGVDHGGASCGFYVLALNFSVFMHI